ERNLIDAIWEDRPDPVGEKIAVYPVEFAGETHEEKLVRIAEILTEAGEGCAVLTLPDSIAWLLNIRGEDIPHNPTPQVFAIVHGDGTCDLFTAPGAASDIAGHLGDKVRLHDKSGFAAELDALTGRVRVDPKTAPFAIPAILEERATVSEGRDPCILPKACKNPTEIAATTEAHLRDGAAMVEFLAWLDATAPKGGLTEIDVVRKLEGFRRATNALRDISFDTICGSGPNGAIIHYRVTEGTNRDIVPGELLLVDSGGQYIDGTTDITRTVAVGAPGNEERACFTRVLQGMIAISRVRWPRGLTGRDLDPLARAPLWMAGQDYDHGTGHGVGVYLNVHEGPQRIARISEEPLKPGMILSNEPGYYREGAFGIRIENLIVVQDAPEIGGGDGRDQLAFETLTFVPIDLALVDTALLSVGERDWLNAYHAEVCDKIAPRVSEATRDWLKQATRAI
ncbi:MAG: aminopeptidase P family protein, partial [Rhodobacteraceae bacterium]|nr:aminopeptidase P family protein [Paracoccaceae bacterium]